MEMNQKECGIVCKENGTEQIEKVRRKKTEHRRPREKHPPAAFFIRRNVSFEELSACFCATAGIKSRLIELVSAQGKRIHGNAIPVSTP